VAIAVVAGCLADFSLGVFLQARVEALENTPRCRGPAPLAARFSPVLW
jgi:hypothetical protein